MSRIGDYDRWFQACKNCGYDPGKVGEKTKPKCWKCGRPLSRDFSDRVLKKKVPK